VGRLQLRWLRRQRLPFLLRLLLRRVSHHLQLRWLTRLRLLLLLLLRLLL
jgi:hypothetical protein